MFYALLVMATVLMLLWFLAHYNVWRPVRAKQFPRILMYHSINPSVADGVHEDLVVTPESLEKQIAYLVKQGYQFVTASELLERQDQAACVALTFDDGFEDNYQYLFPLLVKHQIKATVYLCPHIEGIARLSEAQIKEMHGSGLVEFGAHTMNHVNLEQASPDEAEVQIRESKQYVEALLGEPCYAFAYPFGRFDDSTVALMKLLEFRSSVTVKKGIEAISDPFRIKRISILGKTNMFQFHLAITRGRYRV